MLRVPGGAIDKDELGAIAARRGTPAQAAGVTDRLWEIEDLVALLD